MVDYNSFLPFRTDSMGFTWFFSLFGFLKQLSDISFFLFLEISRVVGGLLSAYDLSEDKLFLDKAREIADRLLPAWDTPSGIPYNIINLAHGKPHNPSWTGVSIEVSSYIPIGISKQLRRTPCFKFLIMAMRAFQIKNGCFVSSNNRCRGCLYLK